VSLSGYLQNAEIMKTIQGKDHHFLKDIILERGRRWYAEHPEEVEIIDNNIAAFGLKGGNNLAEQVKEHILLHYYEKLIGICYAADKFAAYLDQSVTDDGSIEKLQSILSGPSGVLLLISHFGAVELITPFISRHALPITSALRFTTEQFSSLARKRAKELEESGKFGPIGFIEVGKPKTAAALDMAAVIRRGEILTTVCDEETDYSIPVLLFNKKVYGGAGVDRLIKFSRAPLEVVTASMVRTGDDSYRFVVDHINKDSDEPIQNIFNSLEKALTVNPEQWYFLHEEVPFVRE